MSIDATINGFFEPIGRISSNIVFYAVPITSDVDVKLILIWLISIAVFLTVYLGFINVRFLGHAVSLVFGKTDAVEGEKEDGQITKFQALMTSLSGSVGLGNISGVAIAISLGGPGAMFWMIVMAFFGMSTKFAEVMLGVKYRHHLDEDHPEKISGGPMHYLKAGFDNRNIPFLGTFFAGLFSICCIFGMIGGGNMYQSNQAFEQLRLATGGTDSFLDGNAWVFGLVLALLVGSVIIGGIKSIANVASKLVPTMGGIYVFCGLIVILMNIVDLPHALYTVVTEAFSPQAGYGGMVGALMVGAQRAFFSNESGLGTAAIVHSTAKTNSPVEQGMIAMIGPFVDTVLICSITALVIVITGVYGQTNGIQGVELTSQAFESAVPAFKYMLTFTVFLFAFSTMITTSYYASKGIAFFFGEVSIVNHIFKVFYCLCIIVGASVNLSDLIDFADAAYLSLAIPNIIALYIFAPEIKRDVKKYISDLKN